MIRSSALLFILCLFAAARGQVSFLPYDTLVDLPGHRMHRITVSGWADYNSNSIYNELPWNIYQGGFIER